MTPRRCPICLGPLAGAHYWCTACRRLFARFVGVQYHVALGRMLSAAEWAAKRSRAAGKRRGAP